MKVCIISVVYVDKTIFAGASAELRGFGAHPDKISLILTLQ